MESCDTDWSAQQLKHSSVIGFVPHAKRIDDNEIKLASSNKDCFNRITINSSAPEQAIRMGDCFLISSEILRFAFSEKPQPHSASKAAINLPYRVSGYRFPSFGSE